MLTIRPFVSRNLADLQRVIGPNDYIISKLKRAETLGSVSFMSWPSAMAADIYQYAASLPARGRALHSVFGRPGIPMDFCADLDLGLDPSDKQNQRYGFMLVERVCDEASKILDNTFQKKFDRVIALQSFSKKKISYHIHARVDNHTAFSDFHDVAHFTILIQNELEKDDLSNILDTHIFRPNGSLRLYDCVKSVGDDVTLSHVALKKPESWQPLPEELFDLSLSMRKLIDITTKLHFDGVNKPTRKFRSGSSAENERDSLVYIVSNVPKLSVKHATEYKTWMSVGLVCKACEAYVLNHPEMTTNENFCEIFHSFSSLSPKYSYQNCERWWSKFRAEPVLERSAGYIRKLRKEMRNN